MKKFLVLIILLIANKAAAMENPEKRAALELPLAMELVAHSADTSSRASRHSSPDASESYQNPAFEEVSLKEKPLEKEKSGGHIELPSGTIIVRTPEALQQLLSARGVVLNEGAKHRSIVYMPELDIRGIAGDPEKGYHQDPDVKDFEEIFAVFASYLKGKCKNDVDLSPIKNKLIKKFQDAHCTPPPTPHDDDHTKEAQKTKAAVHALHTASQYQATVRTHRQQQLEQHPHLQHARDPKASEAIGWLQSIATSEVKDGLEAAEHAALELLSQKTQETTTTLSRTRVWGTIGGGVVAVVVGVVTNLLTRKDC